MRPLGRLSLGDGFESHGAVLCDPFCFSFPQHCRVSPQPLPAPPHLPPQLCGPALQADNPSFPNPRRRLRLQDLADRVVDASEDEHELNQLLNEALLERESAQV